MNLFFESLKSESQGETEVAYDDQDMQSGDEKDKSLELARIRDNHERFLKTVDANYTRKVQI